MRNRLFKQLQRVLTYVLASLLVVSPVYAYDKDFFSRNDILFYDPTACRVMSDPGVTAFSAIQGSDNAEKIFKFLTTTSFTGMGNKPFTSIQAAGVLGNFQQESGMNPASIEGGALDAALGDGHGLAQWSYNTNGGKRTGPGRRGVLMDLAASKSLEWSDINLQLIMITNELNASYGKSLLDAGFGNVTTPKDASYIFQKIYEGAGTPNQAVRDSAAEAFFQKYKDLAPATTTTATTPDGTTLTLANNTSCTSTLSGTASSASGTVQDNVIFYLQCDPLWANTPYGTSGKTACSSGCGPTAMAMIITALTGNKVTPAETVPYASQMGMYITGQGSSHDVPKVLAPHWGLSAKPVSSFSVTGVSNAVTASSMVIMAGKGPSPYTKGGHYIAIRGVTTDGKWLIFDPLSVENGKKPWEPSAIMSYTAVGSVYVVSK